MSPSGNSPLKNSISSGFCFSIWGFSTIFFSAVGFLGADALTSAYAVLKLMLGRSAKNCKDDKNKTRIPMENLFSISISFRFNCRRNVKIPDWTYLVNCMGVQIYQQKALLVKPKLYLFLQSF